MLVSDRDGAIVFANSETERLFGEPRAALLGQPVAPADPRASRLATAGEPAVEALGAAPRRLAACRSRSSSARCETDDGVLLTSAIRDITDRKRAEAEIRTLNAELERRVAERTRELARSNAELEQFAYVASHDLQEPLRMVASYAQLLARRYQGPARRRRRRLHRAYAVDGATRMQALIDDLLAYSRVGTRGEAVRPDRLRARCCDDALDDLQAAIDETGAVVTPRRRCRSCRPTRSQLAPALPEPDRQRDQVPRRRSRRASTSARAPRRTATGVFAVRDNGIGIEPRVRRAHLRHLPAPAQPRASIPGTGIGLAICKKIVERHGGRIWVESQPGRRHDGLSSRCRPSAARRRAARGRG